MDEAVLHGDDVAELVTVRVTATTVAVPRRFVADGLELTERDRDGDAVDELEIVCVTDNGELLVADIDDVSLNCPVVDALPLADSHALIVNGSEERGEYDAELLDVVVVVVVRDKMLLYDIDVDMLRVTELQREGEVVAFDDAVIALTLVIGHNTVQHNNKIKGRSIDTDAQQIYTTLLY